MATPESYVRSFQWNVIKYRTDRPIAEIADMLVHETQQIDNLLKARMVTYNQAKASVAAAERRTSGSLLTRDLGEYLQDEHFIDNQSEVMGTLLVVVPRLGRDRWEKGYERLAPMVVPRSTALIAEDADHALYSVIVFHKARADFAKAAAEEGFTVRDYSFDSKTYGQAREANTHAQADLKSQWASLARLLKTNFGELFSAWIHIKILRLFVESVLQYGLPPDFLALIVEPSGKESAKTDKKIRTALLMLLEQLKLPGISSIDLATALHSSSAEATESVEEEELWTALNMATRDRDPFVKVTLKMPSIRQ